MKSDDWRDMDSAPLNPYGKAYGPKVMIWDAAGDEPVAAYYEPSGSDEDNKPRWVVASDGKEIPLENAVAWMPIAEPWSVLEKAEEIAPKTHELQGVTHLNGAKEITPEHAHRMREWLLETARRMRQLVSGEVPLWLVDMENMATDMEAAANNE